MDAYFKTFQLLFASICGSDILILIAGIVTVGCLLMTIWMAKSVEKNAKDWKTKRNSKFSNWLCQWLSKFYTLFVTMISIFPLLGMLGTVFGLLGLDLANGDMENIKNNFFIALTSTAWGIIFSVIFKLIHAWWADYMEQQIELAKRLTDDLEG